MSDADGGDLSFELIEDRETTISNPNPVTMEVTVSMAKGSFIRFTLPSGGSFKVRSCGDLTGVRMDVVEQSSYGPRPVD